MKIYCVGDSLTEGDYGIPGKSGIANVKKENYPFFLSQILGEEIYNFGISGISSKGYFARYDRGEFDFSEADVILVMLGTNGGLRDELKDCYINLVKAMENDCPSAKIIIITSPHVTENPNYSNCGYACNVASAVKTAKEFAAQNNYELIDLAGYDQFTAENEKIMQPNDGLHYGELGYKHMATFIGEALVKLFPEQLQIKQRLL